MLDLPFSLFVASTAGPHPVGPRPIQCMCLHFRPEWLWEDIHCLGTEEQPRLYPRVVDELFRLKEEAHDK